MRSTVMIILLLMIANVFGQRSTANLEINERIFNGVTRDTIASITSQDSIYVQFYDSSSQWKLLTEAISDGDTAFVTANDKSAENTLQFTLALESYWTQSPQFRFQIRALAVDTITSNWISIGKYNGAMTLHIKADTSGSNTDYDGTMLTGN